MKLLISTIGFAVITMCVASPPIVSTFIQSAAVGSVKAVDALNLTQFIGVWEQIARKPQFFERNCASNDRAQYSFNDEGGINVHNTCDDKNGVNQGADGVGELPDADKPGQLRVTFAPKFLRKLPFVWAPFWILYIDDEYSYTLIGEPSTKYLWILAREKSLPKATFELLKQTAVSMGYNLDDLIVSGTIDQ